MTVSFFAQFYLWEAAPFTYHPNKLPQFPAYGSCALISEGSTPMTSRKVLLK